MNRGIYTTATGMNSLQRALDVTANNLANVSTTGFKRDALVFQDTLQREMFANGGLGESVGKLGSGATPVEEYTVQQIGTINGTGNPFDMAVTDPNGMFAVKTPSGVRYTRDGSFALDEQRRLVTKSGIPVLDKEGNEITLSQGPVKVERDGRILVSGVPAGEVGVYAATRGSRFIKEGDNLFQVEGNAEAMDVSPIAPMSLETSNVNAVESMLDMIRINRLFELSQKNIQSQDDLLQRLISSLNE